MPLKKFRPLQQRLNDLKKSVAYLPAQYRLGDVSLQTAIKYNRILDAIVAEYPQIRVALPERLKMTDGVGYDELEKLIDEATVILGIMSPN